MCDYGAGAGANRKIEATPLPARDYIWEHKTDQHIRLIQDCPLCQREAMQGKLV